MNRIETAKSVFAAIRRATLAHGKYIASKRAYLDGDELYMREAHFVMVIGMGPPPTMSELAERLEVTAGAISQLALRMEQKGYVQRHNHAEDKRVNIVTLTEKGEALYREHEALDNKNYEIFSYILDEYTPEQIELIKKFEQQIADTFGG